MQLNLDERMKGALKEVLNEGLKVAEQVKDLELEKEYQRMLKNVNQGHYRRFSNEDVETIWYLCDVGARTCDFLLESADTPEQFEKTAQVKEVYADIQKHIYTTQVRNNIASKGVFSGN